MPDLPAPVGEKSKATPFVTHERMGQMVGVQKNVLARVIGVEKKSDVNAKKITQVTKILKLRKENVDKQLKGEGVNNKVLAERLNGIASALRGLGAVQQKSNNENKKFRLRFWRREREGDIETKKKKKEAKQGSGGGGAGGVLGAIKAPFTGVFDAAKTFFGNIIAGSAILGFMNWIKEMDPSQWQGMIKTLQDNAGLILGGILAVAALPVLATVGTFVLALIGAVTVFGPLIAVIAKALAFMAIAAAAIAAIMAVAHVGKKAGQWIGKKFGQGKKWLGERISGGEASYEKDKELDQKMRDAGMDKAGKPDQFKGRSGQKRMEKLENKGRTAEQQKIFEEVEAERARINALEKERNKIIGPLEKQISNLTRDPKFSTGTSVRNRKLNEAGKKKKEELTLQRQKTVDKYDNLIRSGGKASTSPAAQTSIPSPSSATVGEKNITQPQIDQPLGEEGTPKFIPLGDTSGGGEGGASSGSEGGSDVPSFPSDSGNSGNRVILGAGN